MRASTARFDAVMTASLTLMVAGFFSDLWAHSHGRVETFFTIWHFALYTSAGLVFLILAVTWARARRAGAPTRAALPSGYGTSFLGSIAFLIGGFLDMLWHLAFGIEANTSALFSPTHILLFAAGLLMVSGPLRAAWARGDDERRAWIERLPMVISIGLVLSVFTAITQFIDPVVDPFAEAVRETTTYADIYTMRADGSRQTRAVTLEDSHAFAPVWSPDGTQLAFSAGKDRATVMIANADGSNVHPLAGLADREAIAGSWSPDGTKLAVAAKTEKGGFAVELVDIASGRATRLTAADAQDGRPMFSPDGRQISFNSLRDGHYQVDVMRADGGDARPLASEGESWGASWSPDGRRLAYNSDVTGTQEIYVVNADGTDRRRLTHSEGSFEPSWSPDGTRLAFTSRRGQGQDIWAMNADGTGAVDLTRTPGLDEWATSWSTDGTIAYTVGEQLPWGSVPDVRERLGLASVLVQSAIVAGLVVLALVRGGLPLGALAIALTLNTALMSVISDEYRLIPAALFAGLASDLVIRRLRPSVERWTEVRIVAFFVPASVFALHLLTLAFGRGIGWPIHLWTGSVVIAGCVGLLLAFLAAPPPAVRTATR